MIYRRHTLEIFLSPLELLKYPIMLLKFPPNNIKTFLLSKTLVTNRLGKCYQFSVTSFKNWPTPPRTFYLVNIVALVEV